MIKTIAIGASLLISGLAQADCFRLSTDGTTWPRTSEIACVEEATSSDLGYDYQVTLQTGSFLNQRIIATFQLDQIDVLGPALVLGVENPSNSIFDSLKVEFRFDGINSDTGRLFIGETSYYFERK